MEFKIFWIKNKMIDWLFAVMRHTSSISDIYLRITNIWTNARKGRQALCHCDEPKGEK